MNASTMYKQTFRAKKITRAIGQAKEFFDSVCILTGEPFPHGCHIYDRGQVKYSHLADCPYNIVPLNAEIHYFLDHTNKQRGEKRSAEDKIKYIRLRVMPEFKERFEYWIGKLMEEVNGK